MTNTFRNLMREVMTMCWMFIRKNGYSKSEALKVAWLNIKLKAQMKNRIVKFYFQKVSGEIREAYGCLVEGIIPPTLGTERKANDTIQTYYDTEKEAWRSFKRANLLRIA